MSIINSTKQAVQSALQGAASKAIELAPDSWLPGGKPDPLISHKDGLIGAPISRIDGPLKVQGKATFAAEFPLEGMIYASVAFSTVAKGRIAALGTGDAEAAPGVVLVMTHRNAPRMQPMPMLMGPNQRAAGGDNLPIMQDDQIHWNGQPVAVVLAETQEQADYAASLLHVTYGAVPAVTAFDKAKANGTVEGEMMGQPLKLEIGDAEAALAAAPVSIDVTYCTPNQSHNATEPHAATVLWNGAELVVHDASQAVAHTAASLAEIFGIEETQVQVTSPFVGGGFGGKMLWPHQVLGAAAAKLMGRPVRIALSRKGVYRTIGGRPMTEQRMAIAANTDGRFTALIHTGTSITTQRTALAEKIIALEEHFVTGNVVEKWAGLSPANRDDSLNLFPSDSLIEKRLTDLSDDRLVQMDASGVDVQVLSLTTPGTQVLEAKDAVAIARRANDLIAETMRRHPDRCQGFATLPTSDPEAAARKLERSLMELGCKGALLFGRTRERNAADPAFLPIYEAAAHLRVPLYFHPQIPVRGVRDVYYSGLEDPLDLHLATGGIGWHYETGIQILRLILTGVFDRFPDLQMITGHWGEVVLFYLERIDLLSKAATKLQRPVADCIRQNVSVTPSGIFSQRYLRWATEVLGGERVLFSPDYPYQFAGDGEARRFLLDAPISDEEREKIAHGNWERLCGLREHVSRCIRHRRNPPWRRHQGCSDALQTVLANPSHPRGRRALKETLSAHFSQFGRWR